MLEEKRGKKQEELHKVLLELASPSVGMLQENSKPLLTYVIRLSSIYDDDFRHQYSLFFDEVLKEIFEKSDGKDIETFRVNLSSIRKFVCNVCNDRENLLQKKIVKLCDHLWLEISRWEFLFGKAGKLTSMEDRLNKIDMLSKDVEKRTKGTEERFSKLQVDFVAILAIFAAVVIAFSTGSNYLSSALSSIDTVSLGRLVAVVSLCGFVLVNTLFMLMYFIGQLTGKSIRVGWVYVGVVDFVLAMSFFFSFYRH